MKNNIINAKYKINGQTKIAPGRPVRILPDGNYGVVYRKKVFQLHKDNFIDIDGPFYLKDVCPLSYGHDQDKTVDKLEKNDWYIYDSYYTYLMINGSEEKLNTTLDFLESNGIDVTQFGKSTKIARNKKQYDWFNQFHLKLGFLYELYGLQVPKEPSRYLTLQSCIFFIILYSSELNQSKSILFFLLFSAYRADIEFK